MIELHLGDCLEILSAMPEMSVDAIVTDPPYGLSFMGKKWDYDVPDEAVWRECLRVLKPGGHLLCFAGTRTQHRMAVRIEDAGFEIRDMIAWVYGSGFPKSADVSKHLDAHERKTWLNVCKALDKTDQCAILETWKRFSKTVSNAGLLFTKSETATGTNTPKNGSALASVVLQANHENRDALAVIAELRLSEAPHITEVSLPSVLSFAENIIMESSDHAITAERLQERLGVTILEQNGIALGVVRDWQNANITDNLKAVEALKIWLGDKLSSKRADTVALCAALTGDLKHIILSQSETFRSFDMTRQTDCASAINVTIMESTAASLISFMVNTLRSKAIDKAAGAEREVVGVAGKSGSIRNNMASDFAGGEYMSTAPATPEAQQWSGWGTALKPAMEMITVARKPLIGTVAENVLRYGTGAINVDGCRVDACDGSNRSRDNSKCEQDQFFSGKKRINQIIPHGIGRFPANLIHDGSDEVMGLFPQQNGVIGARREGGDKSISSGGGHTQSIPQRIVGGVKDSGSAARFFYCAKASKVDRDEGCEGLAAKQVGTYAQDEWSRQHMGNTPDAIREPRRNHHPTVKPTDLMRYLCRLITPPGGIVLDPFMGSGSTGKAAVLEGFNFIGIEREPEYMEIARARIHAAIPKDNATNYEQLSLC